MNFMGRMMEKILNTKKNDGQCGNNELKMQKNYFFKIGCKEREIINEWYKNQKGTTGKQKKFLADLRKALEKINYDYEVPFMEPSIDKNGNIFYKEGEKIAVGISSIEWEEKAKKFAPEYNSCLATCEELYLWYAYRIATGYWTLSYVCDNILENEDEKIDIQKDLKLSAEQLLGGARDGVNNTMKIVRVENELALMGYSNVKGKNKHSIIKLNILSLDEEDKKQHCATGVIVLKG